MAQALPYAVAALVVAVVVFFLVDAPDDRARGGVGGGEGRGGGEIGEILEDAGALPPRCAELEEPESFVVGKPPKARPDAGDDDLDLAPFAAEVGRSAAVDGGYAAGVRRDHDGVPVAEVALLDARGRKRDLVELGRSRGDMDPPLVRARAGGWAASMLEPNAGGLALRLAGWSGGKLTWGAEIDQGQDESLAHDMAFQKDVGVVVWDDVTEDGKRGLVRLARVDAATLALRGDAVEASGEGIDAELPRVTARPGGFWLAYAARKRASKERGPSDTSEADRFSAERIDESWVELLALDAAGEIMGDAQLVTPRDGHVLAFDLEVAGDGGALIAWRDDDTPTGAQGGRVTVARMSPSGSSQKQLVAESGVGSGVPVLLPGWIAVGDAEGGTLLAPLAADGAIEGELRAEPLLGHGQVLAARDDQLLVARPRGTAVELVVARCARGAAADGG